MEMTDLEKKVLDIIQSAFPLSPRPYAEIGKCVGVSEAEALECVNGLRERKIIRRLGANFQSAKLGFRSTLCAAKVPQDKMDMFIAEVNAQTGVTHNYLRKHAYNIWFTLIGSSWEDVCNTLAGITEKTEIPILNLPAASVYKIRVNFAMNTPE